MSSDPTVNALLISLIVIVGVAIVASLLIWGYYFHVKKQVQAGTYKTRKQKKLEKQGIKVDDIEEKKPIDIKELDKELEEQGIDIKSLNQKYGDHLETDKPVVPLSKKDK